MRHEDPLSQLSEEAAKEVSFLLGSVKRFNV